MSPSAGFGILHEQGCGKSLTAISIMGAGFIKNKIKRVLIVAPVSVMAVWHNEFQYADFLYESKMLVESMVRRSERLNEYTGYCQLQVAITNYEAVWREPFFEALIKWKPDMVVCDESQKIKGVSTSQSKAMRKIGDHAKYRMILTGTPVTATPLDFWAQYRFLDPNIFGKSYFAFARRYAVFGGYENREIVAYQNKDELVMKAHSIAHRVTKADALDLPEQIDQVMYCELEPKAQKAYDEMVRVNVAEIQEIIDNSHESGRLVANNVLTRLLRLQQITGGFVPRSQTDGEVVQVSTAKLDLLKEILTDTLVAGHKIVVFVRFLPEIHAIMEMLDTTRFEGTGKVQYSYIYGAVPYDERNVMVAQFQTDPAVRVFVAQIQTAGLGITLHAADISIFYSLDYNFANWDQCKARIHRIGQGKKVTHIHLLAKKTVDNAVYGVLKQKRSIAEDVVDNWRKYLTASE